MYKHIFILIYRRIAELYRAIYLETNKRGMQDQFEVTLEATHHGPYASIPACFVEIGIDICIHLCKYRCSNVYVDIHTCSCEFLNKYLHICIYIYR
jgi:hypothetical protein